MRGHSLSSLPSSLPSAAHLARQQTLEIKEVEGGREEDGGTESKQKEQEDAEGGQGSHATLIVITLHPSIHPSSGPAVDTSGSHGSVEPIKGERRLHLDR